MIKRYTYQNTKRGNVMPIPSGLSFVDLLYLDREGIGIRLESEFTTMDVTAKLFYYEHTSVRFRGYSAGNFLAKKYTSNSIEYALIGDNPTSSGVIYSLTYRGVEVRYTVMSGDSIPDVLTGISNEINSATYPIGRNLTAAVSGSELTLTTEETLPLIAGILFNWKTINSGLWRFQSGYYCMFSDLGDEMKYVANSETSNTTMPTLPIPSEIEFSDLTKTNDVVINTSPSTGYINQGYQEEEIGLITIKNVPNIPSTTSRAVYDTENSRIVFSPQSPLLVSEHLTLLYR